jgi:cytochrome d ubiquinol oxidase subunit I
MRTRRWAPVFWSFRVMVGMGMLMLAVSWWTDLALWRRRKEAAGDAVCRYRPWQLRLLAVHDPSLRLGRQRWRWYVTEIGRQPFLVYGLLRTADLVAEHPPRWCCHAARLARVYAFLLVVLRAGADVHGQPSGPADAQTPQSPKAALPVGGPAEGGRIVNLTGTNCCR